MTKSTRLKPELAAKAGKWLYVCCETLVKFPGREGVIVTGLECDAYGNTNLRFFHTLGHEETNKQISVGIECARMNGLRKMAHNGGFDNQGHTVHVHVRPTCHVQTIDGDGMREALDKHTDVLTEHFHNAVRRQNR